MLSFYLVFSLKCYLFSFVVNAVNVFDGILQEFSSGIDVDLMPGENDPANQIMPQQPLHCCLFPSKCMPLCLFI